MKIYSYSFKQHLEDYAKEGNEGQVVSHTSGKYLPKIGVFGVAVSTVTLLAVGIASATVLSVLLTSS